MAYRIVDDRDTKEPETVAGAINRLAKAAEMMVSIVALTIVIWFCWGLWLASKFK